MMKINLLGDKGPKLGTDFFKGIYEKMGGVTIVETLALAGIAAVALGGAYKAMDGATSGVHPLAEASGEFSKAQAYCNLCRVRAKAFSETQLMAIDAAGNVQKAALNYQFNTPPKDLAMAAYARMVRPALVEQLGHLDGYRGAESLAEFGQKIADAYGMGERGLSLLGTAFVAVQQDKGRTALLTLAEELNPVAEGFGQYAALGRQELADMLRDKSSKMKTASGATELAESMADFSRRCSRHTGYDRSRCEPLIQNMQGAEEKLAGLVAGKSQMKTDAIDGATWFIDVAASVLENVADDEFDGIKQLLEQVAKSKF